MDVKKNTQTLSVMGSISEITRKKMFWKMVLVAYAAIFAIIAFDIFFIKVPVEISLPATIMLIGLAVYVVYIVMCLSLDMKLVPLKFSIQYEEKSLTDIIYKIETTRTLIFIGKVTATYEFRPTAFNSKKHKKNITYCFTGPVVVRIKYPGRKEIVNKRTSTFKVKAVRDILWELGNFDCTDFYDYFFQKFGSSF